MGIRQRSNESLRDYLQRFRKETLHMTDRLDGMMTSAFISGLRPGRFFKDLIARPPASMEDLFTQAYNLIRVDEANMKNQLRDSRPNKHPNVYKSSFTPLIKSPAEIYVTSEGKAVLRPSSQMFAPAHQRDRIKYCEFHNDHSSSGASERGKNQIDWKQKIAEPKKTNEILMTSTQWSSLRHQPNASPPGTNVVFSHDDPVLEHCNGEDSLIIKADIRGSVIYRVYVDGGSSTKIMRGSKTITTDFMIFRVPSLYKVILGRPSMRQL
nr:hypothetical protein [Tanacetum cinerariifolium]